MNSIPLLSVTCRIISSSRKNSGRIAVEDNPALVRQKSRDFYWYSPILKAQLDNVTADLVVTPKTEEEVIRTLRVAPCLLTCRSPPRGAGTGNYGQAMPLSGGIVLNLAAMNKIKGIHPGRVIWRSAGIVIAELDRRDKGAFRPGPSLSSLDRADGDHRRLHRRRFRRRWLDYLGRVARYRQLSCGSASSPWRPSRACSISPAGPYQASATPTAPTASSPRSKCRSPRPTTGWMCWSAMMISWTPCASPTRSPNRNGILVKEIAPIAAPIPYEYFARHNAAISVKANRSWR